MKRSFVSPIEPLESRIAPAQIFVGASGAADSPKDTKYNTAAGSQFDPKAPVFHPTGDAVTPAPAFGAADTYYLELHAGDELLQHPTDPNQSYSTLIKVTKGTVIAFFVDSGTKNLVEQGELTGLSFGSGAAADIKASYSGVIVTNFNDKTGSVVMDGTLLGPKQSISQLSVGGDITPSAADPGAAAGIFAGGSINNLTVFGKVPLVLTGKAASGQMIDLLPGTVSGKETLNITPGIGEAGGAITNALIDNVTRLEAGGGGVGGKGGIINNISLLQDNDGFIIKGGDGGAATGGKSGGQGGDVTNIFASGFSDSTLNDLDQIHAGAGGSGAVNTGAKGGQGGKINNVFVGFDQVNKLPVASGGLLEDNVDIASGAGGDGKVGGNAGGVTNVKVTTLVKQPVPAPAGYQISVQGSAGGAPNDASGGSSGAGGAVANVQIQAEYNLNALETPDILVAGGKAGTTAPVNGNAKGANGGGVTTVSIVGYNAEIDAGDASSGNKGGLGGSLSGISILQGNDILARAVTLNAGKGGDGKNGDAGKGGDVTNFSVVNSDLQTLTINEGDGGTSGNGGAAVKGKGGAGGKIAGFNVIDSTSPLNFSGVFQARAGAGGNGDNAGGKGGDLTAGTFFGQDLEADIFAGAGGNDTTSGNGGDGGVINNVNITATGFFNGLQVNGTAIGGAGGVGLLKGKGGGGGGMNLVNFDVVGNVDVEAGNGGAGVVGAGGTAGGKGGSLVAVGAFGRDGSGILKAGNGAAGNAPADGGSITGGSGGQLSGLRASSTLTAIAGNGAGGGSGGDVKNLAFGSTADSLRPTPSGNILIRAGDALLPAGTKAGHGGSINSVSGNPSSGGTVQVPETTIIQAGTGGTTPTGAAGGAGGSISNVTITGVGDDAPIDPVTGLVAVKPDPVSIMFVAGDGGDAPTASKGAIGGSVTNTFINNLDPDALVKSVAAGNGGAVGVGKGTAGQGGSVTGFRVIGGIDPVTGATLSADIGVRSGQNFGYTTMGGIFAGIAGAGGAKPAPAGSVTNISADAIASIVAGRVGAPSAVELVSSITLNGQNALKVTKPSLYTITYSGTGDTTPLIDFTDPATAQAAINNLPAADPKVTVVQTGTSTFQLTTKANGDISQYTAEENVPGYDHEDIPGAQFILAKDVIPGSAVNQDVQFYKPFNSGTYTLTFDGFTTNPGSPLTPASTAANVQTALNTLPSINNAGGVTVTGDSINGFSVKFVQNGVRDQISGDALLQEQQSIEVLGVGPFQITYTDMNGVPAPATARIPAGSDAAAVQTALNAVLPANAQVSVVNGPKVGTTYVIKWDQPGDTLGDQMPLQVVEFAALAAATKTNGTPGTPEVQTLSFVGRSAFANARPAILGAFPSPAPAVPDQYSVANLVGAIADPHRLNAPVFDNPAHPGNFILGDTPNDGLIIAKVYDETTMNFTPEALFALAIKTGSSKPVILPAGAQFFDNLDQI